MKQCLITCIKRKRKEYSRLYRHMAFEIKFA
jgi:hypothetical protein